MMIACVESPEPEHLYRIQFVGISDACSLAVKITRFDERPSQEYPARAILRDEI